jgi:hypothetical protein
VSLESFSSILNILSNTTIREKMIDEALLLLQAELASFLLLKGYKQEEVIIDNIGLFETTNGTSLTNSIVITLVNIEEESALKNQSSIKRFSTQTSIYENTPVYLNLYVLITCNYSPDADPSKGYISALKRLSLIIQFLQGKNSFSYASSTSASANTNVDLFSVKFTLELYTLTFEQINHLWGSLGGRQVPFAMYKLRVIGITDRKPLREVPLIEEIDTTILKLQERN